MNRFNAKRIKGAGLIEVLVTMLILSTTLMTLAALQSRSLQYSHGTYLGSQANILAYDILDRMRANKNNLGSYALTPAVFAGGSAPTTSLAALDIYEWQKNIELQMPGAKGGISCDAGRICTVTISWEEINSAVTGRENITAFNYTSML